MKCTNGFCFSFNIEVKYSDCDVDRGIIVCSECGHEVKKTASTRGLLRKINTNKGR